MKKKHPAGDFDAFALFPEVMQLVTGEKQPRTEKNTPGSRIPGSTGKPIRGRLSSVPPPCPPDVSWLSRGVLEDQEKVGDVAAALVLMRNADSLHDVSKTLENCGYQIECTDSADEALNKLVAITYAVVVLHSGFEGGMPLEESRIHTYLARLPRAKRRRIH